MSSDLSQSKSKQFTLEEAVAGTKMSPNLKAKILIVFNNWVQPAVNQGWFVRWINFGVKHEVLLCAFSPFLGGFFGGVLFRKHCQIQSIQSVTQSQNHQMVHLHCFKFCFWMAPLATVTNLANMWRHIVTTYLPPGGATCISWKLCHQVAPLPLPHCRGLGSSVGIEFPTRYFKTLIFINLRRTKTNARNVEVSDCLFCLLLWPHWTEAKSVSGPKVVTTCPQSYFPAYSRLLVLVVNDDDDDYPIIWYRAASPLPLTRS